MLVVGGLEVGVRGVGALEVGVGGVGGLEVGVLGVGGYRRLGSDKPKLCSNNDARIENMWTQLLPY